MLTHAAHAPVLATPQPSKAHPGPRLALGISLLLHGAAMAWMLQDAPPPPEVPAARIQVALLEAPRPQTPPEPVPVEPEPAPTPPVAVDAPVAPAHPEPTPEPAPEVKPRPEVVKREPPPTPAEPRPEVVPEPPAETRAEPAPAIVAPGYEAEYLDNPPPDYPRLSRRLREEGEVELRVRVSPAGEPVTVELARSSGSERLDAAALRAVRQWRFEPARQGGQAVEAWVRVPINFQLEA